jgi:ornithine--oxo-acid transaminase
MTARYELVHEVRGKDLMLAIDFARPQSFLLRTEWDLIEGAREGLFGQLITIPLFTDHKILFQVAGPNSRAVKLLPPLIVSDADIEWIVKSIETVIAASHHVSGTAWSWQNPRVEFYAALIELPNNGRATDEQKGPKLPP